MIDLLSNRCGVWEKESIKSNSVKFLVSAARRPGNKKGYKRRSGIQFRKGEFELMDIWQAMLSKAGHVDETELDTGMPKPPMTRRCLQLLKLWDGMRWLDALAWKRNPHLEFWGVRGSDQWRGKAGGQDPTGQLKTASNRKPWSTEVSKDTQGKIYDWNKFKKEVGEKNWREWIKISLSGVLL